MSADEVEVELADGGDGLWSEVSDEVSEGLDLDVGADVAVAEGHGAEGVGPGVVQVTVAEAGQEVAEAASGTASASGART